MLPHDLQGVAGTVVGGHRVGAVSKDRHGDGLRTAGVPELVLHPVAQGVHRQLPVGDHRPEALHHHGRGGITAAGPGVPREDRLPVPLALPMFLQHLCRPPAQRYRSMCRLGLEAPYSVGAYCYRALLQVYFSDLQLHDLREPHASVRQGDQQRPRDGSSW